MKIFIVAILVIFSYTTAAQQIKRWRITDLENYVRHSDSTVVVNFWATYCVPCKEEIPYFEAITQKYEKNKVKLLLVSLDLPSDYPKKIMEYIRKEHIKAEVVWLDETDADYFIPRVDSSWSGALPATLITRGSIAKPIFFDRQMKPEELEIAIRKMLHHDEAHGKK